MDIKQIVDGKEYIVCCPDSWYIAKQIISEHHEEYDITYQKIGTGAKITLHQKKRMVDFYDKEHVTYLRSNSPPKLLGNLYWVGDALNKVSFSINEEETVCSRKESPDCFFISHDIFKHLREYDIVEIKANHFHSESGKDIPMIFRANKKWIMERGYKVQNTDFGVCCVINKSVFYKSPNLKKIQIKGGQIKNGREKTKKVDKQKFKTSQ